MRASHIYFDVRVSSIASVVCLLTDLTLAQPWAQIAVRDIIILGPQLSPDITDVSRDGGYSVLVNGNLIWLYDDTECRSYAGDQLSFTSNTVATSDATKNISFVKDYGVVMVGKDEYGRDQYAILANETVGTGGWIPFQQDELRFNDRMSGRERVAICEELYARLSWID